MQCQRLVKKAQHASKLAYKAVLIGCWTGLHCSPLTIATCVYTQEGCSSSTDCRYGQRTAEAMQTANAMAQIRIAETFAHIISEHAGILCASAIFSFGSVACKSECPSYELQVHCYNPTRQETYSAIIGYFLCLCLSTGGPQDLCRPHARKIYLESSLERLSSPYRSWKLLKAIKGAVWPLQIAL